MKKIKLLTPLMGLTALSGAIIPLASCSCKKADELTAIPEDCLWIKDNTLKGIKEDKDISSYNKLVVPTNVKIIDTNAFKGVFRDKNKISEVVIPGNVSEIRKGAFELCTGVSVFDFSQYNVDQIHELTIEKGAFGDLSSNTWFATIKLNDSWTEVQKQALLDKLEKAGLPAYWLVQPTEGHVEVKTEKEVTSIGGNGAHEFELKGQYSPNFKYTAALSRVDGTVGVGVKLNGDIVVEDNKTVKVNTSMNPDAGHEMKDGDWVSYKVTLICSSESNDSKIQWIQTIETFKLTYQAAPVVHVEGISLSPTAEVDVNETITLTPTITPENATDKSVTWSSDHEEFATVNSTTGVVTGVAQGSATITATTNDGGKTASCVVTVNQAAVEGIGYKLNEAGTGYEVYCSYETASERLAHTFDNITIPSEYNGKPVTGFSASNIGTDHLGAFQYCKIGKIVIPDTITIIPENCFLSAEITKMNSDECVQIPSGIKRIESWAFGYFKTPSNKLLLNENLEYMGYKAFDLDNGTFWLKENNCVYLGCGENPHYALFEDQNYTPDTSTIHNDVKLIASNSIHYNNFKTIVVPAGLKRILNNPFGIQYIAPIETIYVNGGAGTKGVVTLPNDLEFIGESAFSSINIESIDFSNLSKIKEIPSELFNWCGKLKTINLGSHVTKINKNAFTGCKKINSLNIPSQVDYIDHTAFKDAKITSISVDTGNTKYAVNSNALYELENGNEITLMLNTDYTGTSITIPNTVEKICDKVFSNHTGFTTISIPKSVKEIGTAFESNSKVQAVTFDPDCQITSFNCAFDSCSALSSIEIPASIEIIDEYAFRNCTSLSSLTFAANSRLKIIGDYAFWGDYSLTSNIVLPSGVEEIHGWAFCGTRLTGLTIPSTVKKMGNGKDFYGVFGYTQDVANITITFEDTATEWTIHKLIDQVEDPAGLVEHFKPTNQTEIKTYIVGDWSNCYYWEKNA